MSAQEMPPERLADVPCAICAGMWSEVIGADPDDRCAACGYHPEPAARATPSGRSDGATVLRADIERARRMSHVAGRGSMSGEDLAEVREMLDACIDGGRGFKWGPCHPDGGFASPEVAADYVAALVRRSAEATPDRAREMWGVFVNRGMESLFVCHTGNGPTSEAHARFIAAAPYVVHTLLDHVDALAAYRDEARQEVASLRAQRDEIREAHRVELAAVKAKLAALVEAVASSMSSIQADCHPTIINRLSDALEAAQGES